MAALVLATAAPTAQAADTTPPTAPRDLAAQAGDAQVSLSWRRASDNVGVTGYRLFRRNADGTWPSGHFASTARTTRTFTATGLENGRSYAFRVRAVDRAGNAGPYSNIASATPVGAAAPAPSPAPAPTEPAPAPSPEPAPTEPAPTPDPTAPSTCAAFETFVTGNWPTACSRPFSAESPFNRRVPANPQLLPGSPEKANYLASQGAPLPMAVNNADSPDDWLHPYYFATAGDPLYTLHCTKSWGRCPVEGMQIRMPSRARPAAGGDGHLTVIYDGYEYSFWQVDQNIPSGGGTLNMSWSHGRTPVGGTGLGGGGTAAWFSNLAGIVRAQELETGQINHAMFAIVRCSDGAAVYPAKTGTTAQTCSSLGLAGTNSVPLGARLWLDMSDAQIDALAVPAWKKVILKGLAHYGAIVGDTGAYGQKFSFGLHFESGSTYTSMGYSDRMAAWAAKQGFTGRPSYMALGNVIDWARHLRVVAPCVSQGTC